MTVRLAIPAIYCALAISMGFAQTADGGFCLRLAYLANWSLVKLERCMESTLFLA